MGLVVQPVPGMNHLGGGASAHCMFVDFYPTLSMFMGFHRCSLILGARGRILVIVLVPLVCSNKRRGLEKGLGRQCAIAVWPGDSR